MNNILSITIIILLAAISPGPDFAMVVKNSLMRGRKAGIATAFGVSSSLLIHSTYCILGLAIIITSSLLLFSIIKYIGAAYLIYIGFKSLFAKVGSVDENNAVPEASLKAHQAYVQGLLCNLLNPKAIMFILAFFTLIINPQMSWGMQIGFALEIALIHIIWFSSLALMITHRRVRALLNRVEPVIVKIMGVVLIGFGASIAFLHAI